MIPALPNNSNNIRFNYFIRSDQTKPITVFYHFVRQTVLLIVLRNNSIPCRVSSTGSVGFIGSAKILFHLIVSLLPVSSREDIHKIKLLPILQFSYKHLIRD